MHCTNANETGLRALNLVVKVIFWKKNEGEGQGQEKC